jgi:putative transposase
VTWHRTGFFVIGHDRRKILYFNVTKHPSAFWIVQQMREAWPYTAAHRFLLFDRESKFGSDVVLFAREMGSPPMRTAFRSPWIELRNCRAYIHEWVKKKTSK